MGPARGSDRGVVDRWAVSIRPQPHAGIRFSVSRRAADRRSGPRRPSLFCPTTNSTPPPSSFVAASPRPGLNLREDADGILIAAHRPACHLARPGRRSLPHGLSSTSGYGTAALQPDRREEGKAPTDDPLLPDSSTVVGASYRATARVRGRQRPDAGYGMFGRGLRPPRHPSDYDGLRHRPGRGGPAWVRGTTKVGLVGISYSGCRSSRCGHRSPRPGRHRPLEPDRRPLLHRLPGRESTTTGSPRAGSPSASRTPNRRRRGARVGPRPRSPPADKTCLANQRLHRRPRASQKLVGPGLARNPSLFQTNGRRRVWAHQDQGARLPRRLPRGTRRWGREWPALITALKGDRDV